MGESAPSLDLSVTTQREQGMRLVGPQDPPSADEPTPPRRRRPQELWTREAEPYPGALALWDLEDAGDGDAATIIARFAVVSCVRTAGAGRRRLRREARLRVRYAHSHARPALRRVLCAIGGGPAPLYHGLRAAGLEAATAGHAGGAYTFLRLAYEVATAASQRLPAARAAAHLARLAAADDAPYSAKYWHGRVRALLGAQALPSVDPPATVPGHALVPYVERMSESRDAAPGGGYDAEGRRAIQAALGSGASLTCPACGASLAVSDVPQPSAVSYVRRRVRVVCTGCRRTASVDVDSRR